MSLLISTNKKGGWGGHIISKRKKKYISMKENIALHEESNSTDE